MNPSGALVRFTDLILLAAILTRALSLQSARAVKRSLEGEADKAARERAKRQRLEEDYQVPPPSGRAFKF